MQSPFKTRWIVYNRAIKSELLDLEEEPANDDQHSLAAGLIEELGQDGAITWADGYMIALKSFGTAEALNRWQLVMDALFERDTVAIQ